MFKCAEKFNHKMETVSVKCRNGEGAAFDLAQWGEICGSKKTKITKLLNYKLGFEIQCDPDGDMACIFSGSL